MWLVVVFHLDDWLIEPNSHQLIYGRQAVVWMLPEKVCGINELIMGNHLDPAFKSALIASFLEDPIVLQDSDKEVVINDLENNEFLAS